MRKRNFGTKYPIFAQFFQQNLGYPLPPKMSALENPDSLEIIWKIGSHLENPDSFEIIWKIGSHLENPDSFEIIRKIGSHLEKSG